MFWSIFTQVFYNKGLSSLCRCVSYAQAEHWSRLIPVGKYISAYLFDTLVTGMDLSRGRRWPKKELKGLCKNWIVSRNLRIYVCFEDSVRFSAVIKKEQLAKNEKHIRTRSPNSSCGLRTIQSVIHSAVKLIKHSRDLAQFVLPKTTMKLSQSFSGERTEKDVLNE